MKILKSWLHFCCALVLGIAYLILTNVNIGVASLNMGINDFIDIRYMIACICILTVILYFWNILSGCGKTGKSVKIKIVLLLSIPIFINILSSLMQLCGFEKLSHVLFHWRFVILFITIGFWTTTKLVVRDPANVLLWLSSFSESYKE